MREITPEEASAIKALKRLARRWPKSLSLFSWSGSLVVMDALMEPGELATLDFIDGIPNDGGDAEADCLGYRRRAALAQPAAAMEVGDE